MVFVIVNIGHLFIYLMINSFARCNTILRDLRCLRYKFYLSLQSYANFIFMSDIIIRNKAGTVQSFPRKQPNSFAARARKNGRGSFAYLHRDGGLLGFF